MREGTLVMELCESEMEVRLVAFSSCLGNLVKLLLVRVRICRSV